MIHTAKRVILYAKNKVVHIDAIHDPILRRLVTKDRVLPALRSALKRLDSQYELLIPRKVDSEEMQLKRHIQYKLGTTVDLTKLRQEHNIRYKQLFKYGSPAKVIEGWGLAVNYSYNITTEGLINLAEMYADSDHGIKVLPKGKHYQAFAYRARKEGLTVKQYLKQLGFDYTGGVK